MVFLNNFIPINLKQMEEVMVEELKNIIENELYLLDIVFPNLKEVLKINENVYNKKLNKIKNNMLKKFKESLKIDHNIYRIMDNNYCSFKHKRGNKEGHFCCKKIRTNIIDGKEDFLCCTHSPKHVPKKRIKKSNNTTSNCITENVLNIKEKNKISKSAENINIDKYEDIHEKRKIKDNIIINSKNINLNQIKKNYKKNAKNAKNTKNKLYYGNSGPFIFNNIIKNFTNLLLKQY